ncbi:ribosome maturation factor RimM [Phytoactinopolyspora halotolerans]|uniref:Ribosome maturation factor RimM n=1 Tax=Phytoactinopolyspora halotolerans TaxID=1981512 RepID=A0A6L9SE43_9ACTN|nr:ribosome maturation factor RimM [Phytoactinopolyspora halotolerans]NEE03655.1 ribosome maturation factor RimM [Phytoactinopolyspora halotolerans]
MLVTVGRIGRAHGIRGEVAVDVRTDTPDERFTVGAELRASGARGEPRTLTVARSRWHKGRLLVLFDEVADRNVAEELRGRVLQVEVGEEDRPADPDEYFDHQLIGLQAITRDGTVVGEVSDVIHGPDQDILVVRGADGAEAMVPFVAQIVPEVDLEAGRAVLEPPPGLLELGRPDQATG